MIDRNVPWFLLCVLSAAAVGRLLADEPAKLAEVEQAASEDAIAEAAAAQDDFALMRLFVDAVDAVERNYVAPVSRRELMEAAIEGVLSKLDSYSNYIAPEEMSDFQRDVVQEFGGVGIQISVARNENIEIVSPLANTPASRAGLLAGDQITHISGQPAKGIGVQEAVRRMKGPIGSDVTMTVLRDEESFDVTLTRETVQMETVVGTKRNADGGWNYLLEDQQQIGYIRIASFGAKTADDLVAAMQQLSESGLRGLVLDLRNNPGGLLSAAIDVSDLFLAHGRIVSAVGRYVPETVWEAKQDGSYTDFPMVVLVNRYSASGSEIVAACLQDHDRATVLGQRTWGKGSVQRLVMLEEGKSAIKLTTSTYQRPSGKNIHRLPDAAETDEWGVMPDEGMDIVLPPRQARELLLYQREAFRIRGDEGVGPPFYLDDQMTKALDHLRQQLP